MSTGAECTFTEFEPGRWRYWLQSYPYGETDNGQTYGPFGSLTAAEKHLHDNHANPGGSSIDWLTDGRHVHHFVLTSRQVKSGWTASAEVTVPETSASTADEAIAVAVAMDPDRHAWRAWPAWVFQQGVFCDACGEPKP